MELDLRILLPARRETNTFDSERNTKYTVLYDISTLACLPRAKTQHAAHTICNYAPYAHLDYTGWHCVSVVAPRILQGIQLFRGCVPSICDVWAPDEVRR